MSEQKERQIDVRNFIISDAEDRCEILGEDKSVVERIISSEQSLLDTGLYDSLSFLDLMTRLENEFDIEIDMSGYDLEYLITLDGLSTISSKAGGKKQIGEKSTMDSAKSAQGISFEEITPEHPNWNDLSYLFDSLYEYLDRFGLLIKVKPNAGKIWLESLENVAGKTNFIIGAIDQGKLVGYCHAAMKILPVYLEGGFIGMLMSLFVLPDYRGQNIGDELCSEINNWLIKQKASSIEVETMFTNQRMIEYYQRLGYEKETVQLRKIIAK